MDIITSKIKKVIIKNIILILLLFLFVRSSTNSQVTIPEDEVNRVQEMVYGVGFSCGIASGFGLSFRHHFPGNFSYQLIGGIIKVDKKTLFNFGGEIQIDFSRYTTTRFFGTAVLGYFYKGENENSLDGPLRTGIGIGMEYQQSKSICFTGELVFVFFNNGEIIPLPQISAHYYFF